MDCPGIALEPVEHAVAVLQIDGAWHELRGPVRSLIARTPGKVSKILADVEAMAEAGYHVAGWVAYDAAAGYGLACHQLMDAPAAAFVAFERMEAWDSQGLVDAAARAPNLDWRPLMRADAHASAVKRIRRELAAGNTYQVNLTFPMAASFAGEPFALFARLVRAQRPSCAAYLDFGRFVVCSASPEVFFHRDGDRVVMRPMKGTARRGRTADEDRRRARVLLASPKERAENLMIVDMVRNDLGRVAIPGSVQVEKLFEVERYPTVLQMTSTVAARTRASLPEIFAAMFPCASVTGAPKVRTAEIIRELEPQARGVYTGAVGYAGPGGKARFNVAIRTATVDRLLGQAVYGVGSGIVWDSRPGREYGECLAKARILWADTRPFALLETLRWGPDEGYALLERHLRRHAASARYFDIPYDRKRVEKVLAEAGTGSVPLRVRLLVKEDGEAEVEVAPLPPLRETPVRVGLALEPVDPSDAHLYHKTTRRDVYEGAKASRPDCEQAILWTAAGRVTETDRANLAIKRGGKWVTPPVRDGLLAGTYRAELLATGRLVESSIGVEELAAGVRIAVFNSVSGWREAVFVQPVGAGEP